MNKVLKIFLSLIFCTPWYGWLIFGYIAWVAHKTMKNRTIWVPYLFITPLLLTLAECHLLVAYDPYYILSTYVGLYWGYQSLRTAQVVRYPKECTALLPKSVMPLFLLLTLLTCKYSFGFFSEYGPRDSMLEYAYIQSCIAGFVTGFFWGIGIACLTSQSDCTKTSHF